MDNKKSKKKILITGASGFIGYNACEYFLSKGWEVFGVVRDKKVPKGVKRIKIDLLDFTKLKEEVTKINPSVILHIGAYVVLDRSFEVAQRCIDVNIKGTLNLIEVAQSLSLQKFIFFSTEEVYGKNIPPYKETQATYPPSPYAVSKVAGENLCLLYRNLYGLPVVILRLATIFGYYHPVNRFIPSAIIRALKNEDIPLNSGKNKRDYLFIDELLEAIAKAVKSKKANGEIFNIGHLNPISGKTLAQKIVTLSGSRSKIVLNAFPDREGEAEVWKMDNTKARNILGWKPQKSIDKYLEKTINFYKKQLK